MLKNYLKVAIRNLRRNKTYSAINLFGLAAGTLCCLYIVLYLQDQYSYDTHYQDAKNIYRIVTIVKLSDDKHDHATCSPPIAPALKSDFPEVQQFARLVPTLGATEHLLRYKEKSFYERSAFLADSSFFDLFNWHFTSGNAANALSAPNSIVLLQTVAQKLFNKEDPLNKIISIEDADGRHDFKVTGVIDESAGKSSIRANMFIRMDPNGIGKEILANTTWSGNNFTYSFIKLKPGTNAAALEKKLPAFLNKYGAEQMKSIGMTKELHLEPLTNIHTTVGHEHEMTPTVSRTFLFVLLLIAVLIQVIACINFMNLSTARASRRAKEVGVRKVIGAERKSLIFQFLAESFVLSLLGVLIALPLLALLLPYLNQLTQADIRLLSLLHGSIGLLLLAIVVITGLLAGSYPAFYLSAFQAIKVIKGNFTSHISVAGVRRSLVVFQFVLSIVLIAGIVCIYSQLNYIKNKDLGFDKAQKMIFSFYTPDAKKKMQVFANDVKQLPEVKAVSIASNYPGQFSYNDWIVYLQGGSLAAGVDQQNLASDENFVKAMGIKLVSGRDFRTGDSATVLINKTLMNRLGLKQESAAGNMLYCGDERKYEIAGVIEDLNYSSLRDDIKPFMIICDPKQYNLHHVIISANSDHYNGLLQKMRDIWNKDLATVPFEYVFLDDAVEQQYATEITLSGIINSFTLMAIIISCLGLFGLAAFSAEQRTKEIGIRKVLGASMVGIVRLLSTDFLKLVLLAFVIATPIAVWGISKWLQSFAYKIDLSWWMFILAGSLALCIALFTVCSQAIRAALANPVKSLRSE
jgi:putative ABC transport system permease protein